MKNRRQIGATGRSGIKPKTNGKIVDFSPNISTVILNYHETDLSNV